MLEENKIICQSCAMPMEREIDFGTNADGTSNKEYCTFCFQYGKFTWENVTFEEFRDKLVSMSDAMGLTPEKAREYADIVLPTLRRWAK